MSKYIRLGRATDLNSHRVPQQMSREDYQIFLRWRDKGLKGAIKVYFDVKLGLGKACDPEQSESMKKCWSDLTCRRADVIVEFINRVEIIELKYDAEPSSVGRLLLYRLLWNKEPPIKKPVRLILISDRSDADIELLALEYKFDFINR